MKLLIASAMLSWLLLNANDLNAYSGSHIWSERYGSDGYEVGQRVATDDAGNVFLSGDVQGELTFGGGILTGAGGGDIFLAKLDPAGNHLWSERFGDEMTQSARDIAVDANGNLIMVGRFEGTVDFGGGVLTAAGSFDVFVAKFDSAGNHVWSSQFGDSGYQEARSVAVADDGSIVVSGWYWGSIDFGGSVIVADGADLFLAKLDSAGDSVWSKSFGGSGSGLAEAVAIDASGNVVLAGGFDLGVDFGGGVLIDADAASGGWLDLFLAKFDSAGNHVWSQRFGDGTGQSALVEVVVDPAGDIVLADSLFGSFSFGGATLSGPGIGIAKFDGDGNHAWSKAFGSARATAAGLSVDASGSILVTGSFGPGEINFGGGSFSDSGLGDAYLVKLGAAGSHVWSKRFGDVGAPQFGEDVAVDSANNIFVIGEFQGSADFGSGPLTSAGYWDVFLAKFDGAAPFDEDLDGCTDAEELGHDPAHGGLRDPLETSDFFDVPVPAGPALGTNGRPILTMASVRNRAVSLTDVGVVLAYVGRTSSMADYTADNNGDGINHAPFTGDGSQLDRTPSTTPGKPWRSRAPNGVISLQDVGVALAQVGHTCIAPPN